MRSLLQVLVLCAAAAACVCYDSHESTESVEDLFVTPNRANSFMSPQRSFGHNPRGNSRSFYGGLRKVKSPAERRAETCEDFTPCRLYASRFGFQRAYSAYFGNQSLRRASAPRRY